MGHMNHMGYMSHMNHMCYMRHMGGMCDILNVLNLSHHTDTRDSEATYIQSPSTMP